MVKLAVLAVDSAGQVADSAGLAVLQEVVEVEADLAADQTNPRSQSPCLLRAPAF